MQKFKDILNLSAPLMAAQMAQSMMLIVDTALFGLLGVDVLGGAGLGAGLYQFLFIVLGGFYLTVTYQTAASVGRQQLENLGGMVRAGAVMGIIISMGVALAVYTLPAWLGRGSLAPAILAPATDYLTGAAWITLPAIGFMMLRGLAAGFALTGFIMRISIVVAVLNLPVSYLLMRGGGPIPALGVYGVALGSALMMAAACLGLGWALWRHPEVRKVLMKAWEAKCQGADFKPYASLGIPILLAHAMEGGLFTVVTVLAGTLGSVALAAHTIALQTASLSFNIYIGIAQGHAIRVGQAYGARCWHDARAYAGRGLLLGAGCSVLALLIFVSWPERIITLFSLGASPGALDALFSIGVDILFIAALFQAVDGAQVIAMSSLRALHMGMVPTWITVISYWAIAFPVALLWMEPYGLKGLWCGLGVGLGCAAVTLIVLFQWQIYQLGRSGGRGA